MLTAPYGTPGIYMEELLENQPELKKRPKKEKK